MNKSVAIKIKNLTKIYKLYNKPIDRLRESLNPFKKKYHNDFYALNNISFEIKKGEVIGVIGKNGSGKSTLLKLITNVLTPSSGKVIVKGKISAILELGSGFNPEMSGIENIYLNCTINGMSKKDIDKKKNDIIEFSELEEFINQPIKTYSSGMQARLAFAVSINIEPDILIIDEALSVGDAAFQRKCFAKIEDIQKRGTTILFVSHSEGSIVNLCSRAIWISNGKQIIDGIPKLVAGLYMKHINEKKIDKTKIEKEYKNLINTKEQNKTKEKKISIKNYKLKTENFIEEFYDPTLKAKSTIYYEEKGAKITDVKITTLNGKKVNVLIQGKEYIYSYKVIPTKKLTKVQYGFLIKRKDGVSLGGGAYPSRDSYLDTLSKKIIINIKIICNLNNGEYFLNCGVLAELDDKIDYVHRIFDAYIIKVISAKNNITESINFIKEINLKEIN